MVSKSKTWADQVEEDEEENWGNGEDVSTDVADQESADEELLSVVHQHCQEKMLPRFQASKASLIPMLLLLSPVILQVVQ